MTASNKLHGKTAFVIGASAGLGKEIAKVLASQCANVTIFARRQTALNEAKEEILAARQDEGQTVMAVAADMSTTANIRSAFNATGQLPDILYCVAGGTPNETGFLIDVEPEILEQCMYNNYFSSAFAAQEMLKRWTEDDKNAEVPARPRERKIIFMNSASALAPTPGYAAYSPAKAAQRSLADLLRLEAMRYSGPVSEYKVQIVFTHIFITDAALQTQTIKPELTKKFESSLGTPAELAKRYPSAEKIAIQIVEAAEKGDFAVMDSGANVQLIWANMMGTSPSRGWGIVDSVLAFLMGWVFWPSHRRWMERLCKGNALKRE
ncbi:short chain dehydrogenase [Lentithecium fluviatile CBS 122367]|uniref:Short chain dehydrogenase n=1 Tax=Lentithecium fluviatile CBS 122367 TaxID=1168545 RepID=A0A6G1ING9_9PLEO|nr:short chain dehydrogenase [Lentithecium fluviatile CBS 122367]